MVTNEGFTLHEIFSSFKNGNQSRKRKAEDTSTEDSQNATKVVGQCDLCNKTFSEENDFKSHIKSHSYDEISEIVFLKQKSILFHMDQEYQRSLGRKVYGTGSEVNISDFT